ncbi:MAG TPA: CoA transferase [Cyclobacteriaceae bacterium]|nr:CoA transferase [Cyclobacteriaceae bacterium]
MFTGLKVLELASVLAGPSAGQFFAELGAEVIKVENRKTGGDVTRTWKGAGEKTDDRSAYFCSVNWGKKSIALDLANVQDQEIVRKLALRSDIIIASFKPGDAEKLGVSYAQIRGERPIIYGQITGYGSANDRVGYDAVLQAETGFMDLNGEANGPPIKMPVALIDLLAAHQLKEGLLLALLKKEKTGQGSFVEVSLIQSAVASLANQATNWLVGRVLPVRQGSSHPNIAPYGDWFETKDGKRVLLAVGNDRQFADLSNVLKLNLMNDENFNTNQKRVKNRLALNEILRREIISKNSSAILEEMHRNKIPAGLIRNVEEVFDIPEVKALLMRADGITGVRSFVGRETNSPLLPPPHFGEHTDEILRLL